MSGIGRRMRRIQKKLKKKKMSLNQLSEEVSSDGSKTIRVSLCPDHGPYTADNLCACYDKGGSHEGVVYGEQPIEFGLLGAFCPIHGEYSSAKLCACYDESGNLKDGWDEEIRKEE